jgi:hypothetical protein
MILATFENTFRLSGVEGAGLFPSCKKPHLKHLDGSSATSAHQGQAVQDEDADLWQTWACSQYSLILILCPMTRMNGFLVRILTGMSG